MEFVILSWSCFPPPPLPLRCLEMLCSYCQEGNLFITISYRYLLLRKLCLCGIHITFITLVFSLYEVHFSQRKPTSQVLVLCSSPNYLACLFFSQWMFQHDAWPFYVCTIDVDVVMMCCSLSTGTMTPPTCRLHGPYSLLLSQLHNHHLYYHPIVIF